MPQTTVSSGRSTAAAAAATTVGEPSPAATECSAAIAVQSGSGGGGTVQHPGAVRYGCLFADSRRLADTPSADACQPADFAVVGLGGVGTGRGSFGLPGWSLPAVWAEALCLRDGQLALTASHGLHPQPSWDSSAVAGPQGVGGSSGGDDHRLSRPTASIFQAAAPSASCHHIPDTLGLLPPPYAAGLPFRGGHHRRRHRRRRSRRRQQQQQQQQQQRARHRLQPASAASAAITGRWRRQSSSASVPASGDEPVYSSCCSRQCCRAQLATCLQFRRVLILLASFGVACIVSGVALGALHSPSNSFLTLSLMFVGLGLMLIIVVVIGWRCTPPEHEPCHILFGLGAYCTVTRSRIDRRRRERHYWIGGLLYPEFRFRRPPPSYASAMLDSAAFARRSCPVSSDGGVLNGTALLWDLPNAPPPQYKIDVGLHEHATGAAAPAASSQATTVATASLPNHTAASAVAAGSLPPTYRSSYSGPRLALDEVWLEAAALWAAAAASRAESSSSSGGTLRRDSLGLISDAESSVLSRLDTTGTSSSQGSPNYHSTCHVVVDIENAPSSLQTAGDEPPDVGALVTATATAAGMVTDTDLNCGPPHASPASPASPPRSPQADGHVLVTDAQQDTAIEITPM